MVAQSINKSFEKCYLIKIFPKISPMKSLKIVAVLALVGLLSSCAKKYTCPTYLKNDTDKKETKV